MKSALAAWHEAVARLDDLRRLLASIEVLADYPLHSRDEMLADLRAVISEEEKVVATLERKVAELRSLDASS